jgi:hypothetical protein
VLGCIPKTSFKCISLDNTEIVDSAMKFVRDFTDTLLDDTCSAVGKLVEQDSIPKPSAKKKSLDGALRTFIGTHPNKSLKSLGIDSEVLGEV